MLSFLGAFQRGIKEGRRQMREELQPEIERARAYSEAVKQWRKFYADLTFPVESSILDGSIEGFDSGAGKASISSNDSAALLPGARSKE